VKPFWQFHSRLVWRTEWTFAERKLLPEAGLHGNALASFSAATGQHSPSALGFHSRAKTVRLRTVTSVGLKSALGHCLWGSYSGLFALGKR
jgi:hypothetical protein